VAVAHLVELGIYKGDENGNLNLNNSLTRAELAVILTRLNIAENANTSEETVKNSRGAPFDDVPAWALGYVTFCWQLNLMNGVSATKFDPNGKVNPKMVCTVMLRWLGYKDGSDWTYDTSVEKAKSLSLTPTSGMVATDAQTLRGDVAIVISKAIKARGGTGNVAPLPTTPQNNNTPETLPLEPNSNASATTLTINGYTFPVGVGGTKIQVYDRALTKEETYALAEEAVRLVNIERAKEGLRALALMPEMMEVARIKSQDMVDYNYTSHYPLEGTRARANGNTAMLLDKVPLPGFGGQRAECIAGGALTPESVVQGWMNSSAHRGILLKTNVTHIGAGLATPSKGSGGKWTLIVKEWTDVAVDSDTRGLYPYVEATNPATASTPLKTTEPGAETPPPADAGTQDVPAGG
jgi:uncharacterized protein YkwD